MISDHLLVSLCVYVLFNVSFVYLHRANAESIHNKHSVRDT